MFEFVRKLAMRGERLSKRKLRDHDDAPIPERRVREALERLIDVGRLELEGPAVVLPGQKQHHAS